MVYECIKVNPLLINVFTFLDINWTGEYAQAKVQRKHDNTRDFYHNLQRYNSTQRLRIFTFCRIRDKHKPFVFQLNSWYIYLPICSRRKQETGFQKPNSQCDSYREVNPTKDKQCKMSQGVNINFLLASEMQYNRLSLISSLIL